MTGGPQPAVEGSGSGPVPNSAADAGSAASDAGAGGGVPARTVEPARPAKPGNGTSGNGGSKGGTQGPPARRPASGVAPTQRQTVVPTKVAPAAPLPVGRTSEAAGAGGATAGAAQQDRPGPRRRRSDIRPVVVQGRRTRRVVRKIDVWTVLKMSFLFYLCVFLVFMIAGVVLWNIASAFNVIHTVEKFMRSIFDLQKFTFRPMVVLQSSALGGAVLVVLSTGANVLAALLYNLISDVVGGVQFIVLEETASSE
jgi:hypothetical protein